MYIHLWSAKITMYLFFIIHIVDHETNNSKLMTGSGAQSHIKH